MHPRSSPVQAGDEAAEFQQEMEIMRKLCHPNLVQMVFQVTKAQPMALGLEFLAGGDFSQWLQREGKAAQGEDIFHILFQVASGMAELERIGIGRGRGPGVHGWRGERPSESRVVRSLQ